MGKGTGKGVDGEGKEMQQIEKEFLELCTVQYAIP